MAVTFSTRFSAKLIIMSCVMIGDDYLSPFKLIKFQVKNRQSLSCFFVLFCFFTPMEYLKTKTIILSMAGVQLLSSESRNNYINTEELTIIFMNINFATQVQSLRLLLSSFYQLNCDFFTRQYFSRFQNFTPKISTFMEMPSCAY